MDQLNLWTEAPPPEPPRSRPQYVEFPPVPHVGFVCARCGAWPVQRPTVESRVPERDTVTQVICEAHVGGLGSRTYFNALHVPKYEPRWVGSDLEGEVVWVQVAVFSERTSPDLYWDETAGRFRRKRR